MNSESNPVCTDCGGAGETYQTERRCACQPPIATEEAKRNELARRQEAGWDARVPLTGPNHLAHLSDAELGSPTQWLAERLNSEANYFEASGHKTLAEFLRETARASLSQAEAAWQRQQESLMESGGPDDSAYRRNLINAGRGHLLR